ILTPEHVRSIRPGFGLAPKYYDEVIGKTVKKNISRGTPVSFEFI
ncbi:SAF domain-containing protein, partial [Vibrio sp. Vb2532]